jgi:hypothetical protein
VEHRLSRPHNLQLFHVEHPLNGLRQTLALATRRNTEYIPALPESANAPNNGGPPW